MLDKKNRLVKKKDFENVFKDGKGVKQRFLYVKYKKSGLALSRFGIVAGKNFSKKAVERNKIRRRIREILRQKMADIRQGFDMVVVVLPGAENNYDKLEEEIIKLLKKCDVKTNS